MRVIEIPRGTHAYVSGAASCTACSALGCSVASCIGMLASRDGLLAQLTDLLPLLPGSQRYCLQVHALCKQTPDMY
jgi:hypothetical protein